MSNLSPSVSIVMPTFNSKRYIGAAVESVLAQTFGDWELLIVDDASTDGTVDFLVQRYGSESRINIHKLAINQGAAGARNVAIEAARGRYIAFLDSDDVWQPEKLAVQIALLQATDASMVFSQYETMNVEGVLTGQLIPVPARVTYRDLLCGNSIGCLTAMFDTQRTGKVLMPLIRMQEDWGLWIRLLSQGGWALGIQQPLAILRKRKDSLSSNKLKATLKNYEILRKVGGLNPFQAVWGVGLHSLGAIKRRWDGSSS